LDLVDSIVNANWILICYGLPNSDVLISILIFIQNVLGIHLAVLLFVRSEIYILSGVLNVIGNNHMLDM
jgi:hypothetical protein